MGVAVSDFDTLMAYPVGNRHRREAHINQQGNVAVPLWHNKNKSENPCVATGWLVCPYSFSTKNGPKRGLREGVKKQGCT